jgi:dolichol-phosphate mannosyltransferase
VSGEIEAVVVVPTYNEAENLEALVNAVLSLPRSLTVLVVDDGSPDGTGQLADALAVDRPRLQVMHRSGKAGRGSACVAGFIRALDSTDAPLLMEMDADFSHHPRYISAILDASAEADVVIGSRYVPGSLIVDWGVSRRVFSRLANSFARAMLHVPIRDYTNGYRCYRRTALEKIELEGIQTSGYIVLSEMALLLHKQGASFAELPIEFVNRKRGTSNTTLAEITDAFTSVWRLRKFYA